MSHTSSNLTRFLGQSAVATAALLVIGTGIALACSQPSCGTKCVAPVVHTSPAPKPKCSPKPTVTPAPKPVPSVTPAPKPKCSPKPTATPTPVVAPTPVVTPTPTPSTSPAPSTPQVLSDQTTTTSLPETGSALGGTSVGLGAMISAGVTYARSRKHK
jgi:outer membrane biosynthesis protein TonB